MTFYKTTERAPPLPPRPPTVTDNRPPLRQSQTEPPPYEYVPSRYQQQTSPVELEAWTPPGPPARPLQTGPPAYTTQSPSWSSAQTQYFPPPPKRSVSQFLPPPPCPPTTNAGTHPLFAELPHRNQVQNESAPYKKAPPAQPLYEGKEKPIASLSPQSLPDKPKQSFWSKLQTTSYADYSPGQPEPQPSRNETLAPPTLFSQAPEVIDNAASLDAPSTYQPANPPSYSLTSEHVDNAALYHSHTTRQGIQAPLLSPSPATAEKAASYHSQISRQHTTPPSSILQETVDDAASYFPQLSLQRNNSPNPPLPQNTIPTPRPKIQYDSPVKYTLRECPTTVYHLVTPGTWYIHPQVPEFKVCAYCYEKHILSSRFETSFNTCTSPAGGKPSCLFSVPRIKDSLWPRALQEESLKEVLEFFAYRLTLPVRTCPGEGKGVKASEGVKWFQLNQRSQGRFPQFLACEACFENVLLASPIRDEFSQCTQVQATDLLWACDVAVPFIGKLATKADLNTFIAEALGHLELAECAKGGTMVDASSRRWYQPRGAGSSTEGLSICERCYNDFMAHTSFKNHFQLANPNSYSNAQRRCLHGLYQSRSVWGEAVESNDFSIWLNAMIKFIQYPPCTLQIAPGTAIYQIPGVENFDVCQSCFVGIIQPHGLDRFFQATGTATNSVPRACDLNPGHPSFAKYAIKLDEAMITATFSTFTTYVSRVSDNPPCPKLDLVKGRNWYGETGCRICPSCYEEVCRDTYLSQFFQAIPELLPPTRDGEDGIHCDMYSPRMRTKWQSACTSRDFHSFMQFATYRKSIYDRTVPEMRSLVQQAKLNLAMQKMHNSTSTFYNAMDGASAWQYNPNIRFTGGGVGGSFATPWGVTGAQEGQAAWGLMTSTSSMTSRVRSLEGMWHAVE
ncbi:hypothetical protein BDV06DRAFT_184401 [Aspergillus oleicola]